MVVRVNETPLVEVNALTYLPPAVEINGVKYQRRRLGIMDEVKLAELFFKAFGELDLGKIEDLSMGEAGGMLIVLLQKKEVVDDLLGFLRSVLVDFPLSVDDMRDPNKFPMGSELRIVESIIADKDVQAFFASVQGLFKLRGKVKKRLPSKLTSSKADMAGQTT